MNRSIQLEIISDAVPDKWEPRISRGHTIRSIRKRCSKILDERAVKPFRLIILSTDVLIGLILASNYDSGVWL